MVAQIAEDTRTPADVIIKPQYLRNLCWTDEPQNVTLRNSSPSRARGRGRSRWLQSP